MTNDSNYIVTLHFTFICPTTLKIQGMDFSDTWTDIWIWQHMTFQQFHTTFQVPPVLINNCTLRCGFVKTYGVYVLFFMWRHSLSRHFLQGFSWNLSQMLTLCAVYKLSLCSCYAALYRRTSGYSTDRCRQTLLSPTLTPDLHTPYRRL